MLQLINVLQRNRHSIKIRSQGFFVTLIYMYNGYFQSYNLRCLALSTELGRSIAWPGISVVFNCITLYDVNAIYLKVDHKTKVIFSDSTGIKYRCKSTLNSLHVRCLVTLPLPLLGFPWCLCSQLGKKKKNNTCSIHSDLISAQFEVAAKNIEAKTKLSNQFLQSSSHRR